MAEYDETNGTESIKEREWLYYFVRVDYTWNIKRKFKFQLGVNALERKDLIQDRYGYRKYQPFIKVVFKGKKLDIGISNSVSRRTFHTLRATDTAETPLIHEYIRASVKITWKPSEKLHVILKSSAIRRIRNFSEGAKSFLSYDNGVASLGVRWHIF